MRIWVIGRSYPLPINNMQGSFELEQAKMLAKHGNDVSYVACVFHPFKKIKKWGFEHWREDGIDIYTFSQFYAIERMKLHVKFFQGYIWRQLINRIIDSAGFPDIIHVHYPSNITIAEEILGLKKHGCKVICTEHWTQVLNRTIDSFERNQLISYVENANAFICVGYPLMNAVKSITNTNQKIYVVPNILNDYFVPLHSSHTGFNLIAVGVLFPHKQFDKIIQAFASVDNTNMHLTIVGGGPEEKRLKLEVEKYDLSERISFTGKLDRLETARAVGNSDALICYSKYETFGVPVIEAWGCGIPVIASSAVSVNQEWDSRLGICVSPDNIDELKQAITDLHQLYDMYDRKFIKNYARQNYSEDIIYTQLLNIYLNS